MFLLLADAFVSNEELQQDDGLKERDRVPGRV